jgi:hypothetical protein
MNQVCGARLQRAVSKWARLKRAATTREYLAMTRIFLVAVALATLPLAAAAGETVVQLSVRPMPAPRPALKYQLLPELRELNPGNATHYYLRCFAEQRNFFFSKEATVERARYLSMPLANLPAEKLRNYGGFALEQADWAARLDTCDWQLLRHVQSEEMDLLQAELGRLQILAMALQVRFRGQVAGQYFNDAIRTAKTMFALARHLGEYPREAANRLGLSVAELALGTLEEMVQQPGCPNLYWALTDLPSPLVDLRKGLQGDRARLAAHLQSLRDDAPMPPEQLEKIVSNLSGVVGFARAQAGQAPRSVRALLATRVKDPERVRAARGRLLEAICADDTMQKFPPLRAIFEYLPGWHRRSRLVESLPPLQVVLLNEKCEYEARWDESLKLLNLSPWQIDGFTAEDVLCCCEDALFAEFLPHVIEARRVQARLEQRLGLLRNVEALRLYAAEHDGGLPQTQSELPVPPPLDPFTGRPFVYTAEAATAHLRGSPPRGEEQNPCFNVRYEVTIQK